MEAERFDVPIVQFLLGQLAILKGRRQEIVDSGDTARLGDCDGVIADTDNAVTTIARGQLGREKAREQYEKWRAILPQCREALDKYEALGIQVERAGFKLGEMRSRVEDAFNKLLQTRDSKPTPERFPTDADISAYNAREQKAAAKHGEAVARLTASLDEHQRIYRQQWQHKLVLDKLLFDERQIRPREEPEPAKLLSGVR